VGAVFVQVVLLGLRIGAIFLVILTSRGQALFLNNTKSNPRVSILIEDKARRLEGLPCFLRYIVNIQV
jgi:hypothetical protein